MDSPTRAAGCRTAALAGYSACRFIISHEYAPSPPHLLPHFNCDNGTLKPEPYLTIHASRTRRQCIAGSDQHQLLPHTLHTTACWCYPQEPAMAQTGYPVQARRECLRANWPALHPAGAQQGAPTPVPDGSRRAAERVRLEALPVVRQLHACAMKRVNLLTNPRPAWARPARPARWPAPPSAGSCRWRGGRTAAPWSA